MNTPASDLQPQSGFYPTPRSVIDLMLRQLGPISSSDRVLEPSAGRGDIADRLCGHGELVVVEPHPVLAQVLRRKGYDPVERRFEAYAPDRPFDRVVMNPPFAGGLDMRHVRRAFELLVPGGVIVALMNDGDLPGDGTDFDRETFAVWLVRDRRIGRLSMERLPPELFTSAENFRPSQVPIKMLCLCKARAGVLHAA